MRRPIFVGSLLAVAALAAPSAFAAGTRVVPGIYASTPGDVNNLIPLSWGLFCSPCLPSSGRVQQLYSASEFTDGPAIQLTGIAFRPDEQDSVSFGSTSGTIQSIEIHLSTKPAGALSSTFANNVGADDTIVYSGAVALTYDPSGQSVGSVRPFMWAITFTTPFVYHPANGDLLVDFKTVTGVDPNVGTIPTADATTSLSRVATSNTTGTVGDATGTVFGIGLITRFSLGTTPVELLQFTAE